MAPSWSDPDMSHRKSWLSLVREYSSSDLLASSHPGQMMRRSTMDKVYCGVSCMFGALTFLIIQNVYFDTVPRYQGVIMPHNTTPSLPSILQNITSDQLLIRTRPQMIFSNVNPRSPGSQIQGAQRQVPYNFPYRSWVPYFVHTQPQKTSPRAVTRQTLNETFSNTKIYHNSSNVQQPASMQVLANSMAPNALTQNATPNDVLFRTKPMVIWTNDLHIATTQDVRNLLEPLGVKFIDKSLTPKCKLYNSCADNLTVIGYGNALTLHPALIPQFYARYKDDWQMRSVDAFVCYHPASMCELFMPFNKSMIVIASTRFELGRFEPSRWTVWIQNLLHIARDPKNFVGANNLYDAKYIKYFTGLDVPVVPSYCGYTKGDYNPTRPGFLTFAGRLPPSPYHSFFRNEYVATCLKNNCSDELQLVHFRTLYPFFKFQDLASHKGVIFVPYQVSIMTIFELYRMNVPMFFPSLELLSAWQLKHTVVKERTFLMYRYHIRSNASIIPPHPSQVGIPDPNDDSDLDAIKYWFRYADFYQLPHIIYFDSVYELITKLKRTNLAEVSARMREYNKSSREKIMQQWRAILQNVAKYSQNHPS